MYEEYLSEYFLFLREKLELSIYRTGIHLNRTQKEDLQSYLAEKYIDIICRMNQGKTQPENPKQYVIRSLDRSVLEYMDREILNNRNKRCKFLTTEDLDRLPDEKLESDIPFYKLAILRSLNKLEKKVVSLKANQYTHDEISYMLNISENVSKKVYVRAKSKILQTLHSEWR
jgi:DNA-directed RNA polymerase specialized sigma24 family protein